MWWAWVCKCLFQVVTQQSIWPRRIHEEKEEKDKIYYGCVSKQSCPPSFDHLPSDFVAFPCKKKRGKSFKSPKTGCMVLLKTFIACILNNNCVICDILLSQTYLFFYSWNVSHRNVRNRKLFLTLTRLWNENHPDTQADSHSSDV